MSFAASLSLGRTEAAGIALLHRPGMAGATPLVFLHGVGSNAESWVPLLGMRVPLAAAYAWDAPGYGASAALSPTAPVPADYAAALERVLDRLGIRRVILVGHSLGCLFAAAFAATRPDRVAALGLVSPALGYAVPPGAALPPGVQARIDDLHRLGPASFAAARAARLVHDPDHHPETLARVREGMQAVRPDGYAQAVRALGAGDLLADAARLRMPVAVAVGAQDVVTPPVNARRLHAVLPPATPFLEVPDCGHALPQEQPHAVAAFLAAVLFEAKDA